MFRLTLPLVLLTTLALAACGVKGPLEPPPGAPKAATPTASTSLPPAPTTTSKGGKTADTAASVAERDPSVPRASWEKQKQSESESNPLDGVVKPDRPFILDGLL